MCMTVIDPTAVRSLARSVADAAAQLGAQAPALRGIPELSDVTPAGAALREFTGLCERAGEILAQCARQLATATHDGAVLWCSVDRAVWHS